MPKKEIKESELEEEVNEEVEEDEEEIEEEIFEDEDSDFIDKNKFIEFMQNPQGSFSTTLEQVNSSQEIPISLEQDLMQSTTFDKGNLKDDPFNYSAKINNSEDQPKYQSYEDEISQPHATDLTSLGMNSSNQMPEVGFTNSLKEFESSAQEKYNPVKTQDISSLGKENPFERKEVKYKSSRS